MSKGSFGCLYIIFLYWIYRGIGGLMFTIALTDESSVLQLIMVFIIGFLFIDIFFLPMMPLNIYIFLSHLKGLQDEKRNNWYNYLSYKQLIISSIIWLACGALVTFMLDVDSHFRIKTKYINPLEEPYPFWIWFVLGNIFFLTLSSLLWHYYIKKYISKMNH